MTVSTPPTQSAEIIEAEPTPVVKPYKIFKSRAHTMGYVFRSGANVHFVNHRLITKIPAEIAEMTAECEAGHPNFYIDPEDFETDNVVTDPHAALREQIRQEELVKLLASDRDFGKTEWTGKISGIANSTSIRSGAAESGSGMAQGAIAQGSIKVAAPTSSGGATATKL